MSNVDRVPALCARRTKIPSASDSVKNVSDLLVAGDIIEQPPSMICSKVKRYAAGDTGVLVCEATVPYGPTLAGQLFVEWKKVLTGLFNMRRHPIPS